MTDTGGIHQPVEEQIVSEGSHELARIDKALVAGEGEPLHSSLKLKDIHLTKVCLQVLLQYSG